MNIDVGRKAIAEATDVLRQRGQRAVVEPANDEVEVIVVE